MIPVLFVDALGPYPKLPGVDFYDEARDARTFTGPGPIVAHPPCGPWGRLRHLSKNDDPSHAPWAVEQVRRFGGVLEHPKLSKLWHHCSIPEPQGAGEIRVSAPDAFGGWTLEIDQCRFGHVARKMTWLYICGTSTIPAIPPMREPTHWISGFRSTHGAPRAYKRSGSAVPPGIKVCSVRQRRRTPVPFALWLLEIARSCYVPWNVVQVRHGTDRQQNANP